MLCLVYHPSKHLVGSLLLNFITELKIIKVLYIYTYIYIYIYIKYRIKIYNKCIQILTYVKKNKKTRLFITWISTFVLFGFFA